MPNEIRSVVIIHFEEGASLPTVHVIGGEDVRLLWVDDNAPNDRVFEQTSRSPVSVFRELIHDGTEIGSVHDHRHAAIINRINAFLDGRSPFIVVEGEDHAK